MDRTARISLYGGAVLFAILSAVFLTFPAVDLWFSSLFATDAGRFPAARSSATIIIRHVIWNLCTAVAVFALVMLIANFLLRPVIRLPSQVWEFVCLSYILGPGVLVNLVLKSNWGRARPQYVEAFGGDLTFSPPLLVSDQCARNCSFVSGEASAVTTIALVLALLLLPTMSRKSGLILSIALIAFAGVGSLLRVAMGRHFLSDVLFAADLSLIVTAGLYLWLGVGRYAQDISVASIRANIGALIRAAMGHHTP